MRLKSWAHQIAPWRSGLTDCLAANFFVIPSNSGLNPVLLRCKITSATRMGWPAHARWLTKAFLDCVREWLRVFVVLRVIGGTPPTPVLRPTKLRIPREVQSTLPNSLPRKASQLSVGHHSCSRSNRQHLTCPLHASGKENVEAEPFQAHM